MAEIEAIWMENLGDNFGGLNEPRTGPIEEMMAIDQINSPPLNRAQILPRRIFRQQIQIRDGLRNPETAGQKENDLRIGFGQALPVQPRRMFARLRKKTATAGNLDQF